MPVIELLTETVAADDYPQLLPESRRRRALGTLRSDETLAKAGRIIALRKTELHAAVLEMVAQMEQAARARDWKSVYATAHEVRGLAGTAGLSATGRIANGLCHYLDAIALLMLEPDLAVASLHLDAIVRSVRTEDDAARHGDVVALELSALVARKLSEIGDAAAD
jgi:Hpt domain